MENTKAKGGYNKIYYGAPGCGKSYLIKKKLEKAGTDDENIYRVTFHPEYANCDFVGQIMPDVETRIEDGKEINEVKYRFNPGPFALALEQAHKTDYMVYLIVEEINRGNAAAIFGDLFQLLDRVKDSSAANIGESEYPISNPSLEKYLKDSLEKNGINTDDFKLVIPQNLTILATMNTSDQNVFTLDTAFKRRWSFEQISNDIETDNSHTYRRWYVPGTNVTWEKFVTALNDKILEYKINNQTNEDKRLGKYFVTKECLTENIEDISNPRIKIVAQNFAYKVLEYVWNDVCKIGREEWFDTLTYRTLEELIDAFMNPNVEEGKTPLSVFQNIDFK